MVFLIILFFLNLLSVVDVIVISRSRPLQLNLCLETLLAKTQNTGKVTVLYLPSDKNIITLYKHKLEPNYSSINFKRVYYIKNFSFSLRLALASCESDYVLFLTDEMVFTRDFDFADCVLALQRHPDAYSFSLRLGANISNYSASSEGDFIQYNYNKNGDWSFKANCLEGVIYRKSDILPLIKNSKFKNLSQLTEELSTYYHYNLKGLSFTNSKLVKVVVNYVPGFNSKLSDTWHRQDYSVYDLASIFLRGYKIDSSDFDDLYNTNTVIQKEFNYIK